MIVRAAKAEDIPGMVSVLNPIIERGGTTAHTTPVSASDFSCWMNSDPELSAWSVAEERGLVLGMQWIVPNQSLPPEMCDISTFAHIENARRGVGSALFSRTAEMARGLGYLSINASIRTDNALGLAYYSALGFVDWSEKKNVTLKNGLIVDKVCKRYELAH